MTLRWHINCNATDTAVEWMWGKVRCEQWVWIPRPAQGTVEVQQWDTNIQQPAGVALSVPCKQSRPMSTYESLSLLSTATWHCYRPSNPYNEPSSIIKFQLGVYVYIYGNWFIYIPETLSKSLRLSSASTSWLLREATRCQHSHQRCLNVRPLKHKIHTLRHLCSQNVFPHCFALHYHIQSVCFIVLCVKTALNIKLTIHKSGWVGSSMLQSTV